MFCQMYSQLQPDNHTDLVLDEGQSDFLEELWDGEKVTDITDIFHHISSLSQFLVVFHLRK